MVTTEMKIITYTYSTKYNTYVEPMCGGGGRRVSNRGWVD